jgi:hypothetical protein
MCKTRSKVIFQGVPMIQGLLLAAMMLTMLTTGAQAQVSQYSFTYYYTDGSGDYYTGYVFAPTNFQASGPFLNVGKMLTDQPESMGGQALGGYYYITSIIDGYDASYDKKEYITAYYDNDKAHSSFAVSNNDSLASTGNYVYVSNRSLDDEFGYAIRYDNALVSSFNPYFEADLTSTYRFVVIGDSQSETGINETMFNTVVGEITANVNPDFLLMVGDQSEYGGTTQLEAWDSLAEALRDDGIEVYVAKTNHTLTLDGLSDVELQSQYQSVFHSMPDNGPAGYEDLVYTFRYGNSSFIVLDAFFATAGMTYNEEVTDAQLNWLNDLNIANSTFRFAFSHDPAYSVTDRQDDPELWQTLTDLNFNLYFAGHEHLYSRWTIDGLPQIITGTTGAPFVYGVEANEPEITVTGRYNFVVVDVDGSEISLTTYGYNTTTHAFVIIDTANYSD